jgi:di/tricarboxylate transporter
MSQDQITILAILGTTIGIFLWGRWRHDVVAVSCLLACVFAGLVPGADAFFGFGHPAVITVACVLVLSLGLQSTGAVDVLAQKMLPRSSGPRVTIAALTALGAVLSAFMNNVGAMALLMPLALQISKRLELPPGKILMPLSFGTILGGMTTLIGTPPNLIVSGFRAQSSGESFSMFDFSPAGLAIAGAGIVFVTLLGWRIVPARDQKGIEGFDSGTYLTEALVTEKSTAVGQTINMVDLILEQADAQVVAMIRNDFRVSAPNSRRVVRAGDILVIEAEPESLVTAVSSLGLVLEKGDSTSKEEDKNKNQQKDQTDETVLGEMVIKTNSLLIGRTARAVKLRTRFNINLLAISRHGNRTIKRIRNTDLKAGDVLLLQSSPGSLAGFASEFNCLPLAARSLRIPNTNKALMAVAVMILSIAGAAFGLMSAAVAFASGVLAYILLGIIPLRRVYEAVDWPVIVLLGALIPVAMAMETTGTADLLARTLLDTIAQDRPVIALVLILVVTMTLSDFMNNAATAAVMCPIAISTAGQLGANADTFLMAVAVGASCAFLTPIGHQNNTLILGPGGFKFSDYWKLGLPMEILVVAVGVPMLLIVWPL